MPECFLCHKIFIRITGTHLMKKHNITSIEYKSMFPNADFGEPWNKGKIGIYSEETLKKMSLKKIGLPPPNKGKKMSEESKQKDREHQLGKKHPNRSKLTMEQRMNISIAHIGLTYPNRKKFTEEQCMNISRAHIGLKYPNRRTPFHFWSYESPEHLYTKIKISEFLLSLNYNIEFERYVKINGKPYRIDIYASKPHMDPLLFEVGFCKSEKLFNLQSRYAFVFQVPKILKSSKLF